MEAMVNGGAAGAAARTARVREWIRVLSQIPVRYAGTPGEREAAERIAGWMRELGWTEVQILPAPGRPRPGLVLAIHGGVGALGVWLGGLLGALLALLAAWSFGRELRRRRPLLSRLLPAVESVNVVGRRATPEEPARRVVVSAHIDTTQAGVIFRPFWADLFSRFQQRDAGSPPGALAVPDLVLKVGALVAVATWLGAHGTLFGLLHFGALLALGIVFAIGVQWAASPPTPGANDNASAVAAMLLTAERLRVEAPAGTELWLVGCGAEEVGCVGMHAFVEERLDWDRERTYFVNYECVGGGTLHYIRSEGMLDRNRYEPALLDIARRLAASGAFGTVAPIDLLAATDGHVPAAHGYPALSLICVEANGVPRNYHRIEDTVDGVDLDAVVRAADFGAAVALAATRGAGDPLKD